MPPLSPSKKITSIFCCLFLLFAIPLTLATWMFIHGKPLVPHTTNHGQLIQPPLDIANLGLLTDQQNWKNHWLLLYVNPTNTCTKNCEQALYNMRQIRTATGKDRERVQRAILTFSDTQPFTDTHLQQLLKTTFSGTLHLTTSLQAFFRFTQQDSSSAKIATQYGGIYLADPHGNVMLFYPPNTAPMGIFKDLTRLLNLSQIG